MRRLFRTLTCVLAVAMMVSAWTGASPQAPGASAPVDMAYALALPGGDNADHDDCNCDVLGSCHAPMTASGGTSGSDDTGCRRNASPFGDRLRAGIVPEVPSPPPRA